MRVRILLSLALISLFTACKQTDDTPVPAPVKETPNKVTLDFTNQVGNEKLVLNSGVYTNQNGDEFRVTKFSYFISNVKLKNADGSEYTLPGNHYLLTEIDAKTLSIQAGNVPDGSYTSISFLVGIIDSTNQSAIHNSRTDSIDGMWLKGDAGYIMVNMEGMSPASNQPEDILHFHIGGSAGSANAVKTVTLQFPQTQVINNNSKHIHLTTDLLKMFGPGYIVDFRTLATIYSPGDNAGILANNYKYMFSVTAVGE